VNALEQWLGVATHELTPESVSRVRAEIEEHYSSAIASGASEADAVVALGDPKAANHEYRKVLLTTRESLMAPVYTQPRRYKVQSMVVSTIGIGLLVAFFSQRRYGAANVPVLVAIWAMAPLRWLLDYSGASESTIRYVGYISGAIVVAMAWWYQGWVGAGVLAVIVLLLRWVLEGQKTTVLRKLAAGQRYSSPPDRGLTQIEAIFLNTLRNGDPSQKYAVPVFFIMVGALTVWQPLYFGGVLVMLAMRFTVPYVVDVYTPERSRWFRIAKWALMCVAAALPVLWGAKASWVVAAYLVFLFWLVDVKRISLRRKLPIEEWPKELYL